MSPLPNAAATHALPAFVTAPGQTDVLMIVATVTLILAVLGAGVVFLHIHSLPERMAHKSQKLQFELVAVLCLLALLTHTHIFWVAGLLLAFIDLPDIGNPLRRIATSSEKIAGIEPEPDPTQPPELHGASGTTTGHTSGHGA